MTDKPTTVEFLSRGVIHQDLPPQLHIPAAQLHPLRRHLIFMDDAEGQASLILYHHGLLAAVPQVAFEFETVNWRPRHLPPLSSSAALSPQGGRLSLGWRPDGTGIRQCRHSLSIDAGVSLNGASLPSSRDGDAWQVQWPVELDLQARVEGEGEHSLILRPRSYDLTSMLGTVDIAWLADSNLLEEWALTIWEWQKTAILWIALKRLEGGDA